MMRTEFHTFAFATLLGGAALVGPAVVAPALISSAMAQDVVVEHYDEDTGVIVAPDEPAFVDEDDGPVVVEEYPDVPPARYEPPVYGWIGVAPSNCGTFKYWNGERCADAGYGPEE
jgi:hypothetical protein